MYIPGLPDFSWYLQHTKSGENMPNYHKIYQMSIKISNGREIDQMSIKYINIFHWRISKIYRNPYFWFENLAAMYKTHLQNCPQVAPARYRSTVLSVMETMFGLGLMIGPFLGSVLYEAGGFYLPFVTCGAALAACPIIGMFTIGGSNGTEQVPLIQCDQMRL
jgi:hypothetical protein